MTAVTGSGPVVCGAPPFHALSCLSTSLHPETLEWPRFLSPLTGAPIFRREFRSEEIPDLRDGLSRSLARDFGLDPEDGDYYAAKFLRDIERLLYPPDRGDIVERVVALGEAQARLYRELLAHPAIDGAARRRCGRI